MSAVDRRLAEELKCGRTSGMLTEFRQKFRPAKYRRHANKMMHEVHAIHKDVLSLAGEARGKGLDEIASTLEDAGVGLLEAMDDLGRVANGREAGVYKQRRGFMDKQRVARELVSLAEELMASRRPPKGVIRCPGCGKPNPYALDEGFVEGPSVMARGVLE